MTRITSYGEREMTIIERLNTRLICAFLDHNFYVCRIGRDVDNWVQCERCKHVVPRMSIESYLRTRYSQWRDRHFTKSA